MADPKLPDDVVSREVSWHLEDGTPTSDKSKAATAEVVTTFKDGRITNTLMRRGSTSPGA